MLRYRAAEMKRGEVGLMERALTDTDRNGAVGGKVAGLANWASDRGNALTRPIMERIAGVHRDAELPKFNGRTFALRARKEVPEVDTKAPAHGRKAVLYATCNANYNNPQIGMPTRALLARNGEETEGRSEEHTSELQAQMH